MSLYIFKSKNFFKTLKLNNVSLLFCSFENFFLVSIISVQTCVGFAAVRSNGGHQDKISI